MTQQQKGLAWPSPPSRAQSGTGAGVGANGPVELSADEKLGGRKLTKDRDKNNEKRGGKEREKEKEKEKKEGGCAGCCVVM